MDVTHLHLMLNHLPVAGVLFGVLFLIVSIFWRNQTIRFSASMLFLFSALITIPAYISGSGAEERVEHLAGINSGAIGMHEEAAELAFVGILALGFIGSWASIQYLRRRMVSNWIYAPMGLTSLLVFALIWRTALYGGEIRHTELRTVRSPSTFQEDASIVPQANTEHTNTASRSERTTTPPTDKEDHAHD